MQLEPRRHQGRRTGPLFSLYIMSFVTVIFTALLFKGRFNSQEPFALELPPYRFPTVRQMFLRGWLEISHFLRRATKFITIGVVLVWILTNMPYGVEPASAASWSGWIGEFMAPILSPAGINPELTIALIFGCFAKTECSNWIQNDRRSTCFGC